MSQELQTSPCQCTELRREEKEVPFRLSLRSRPVRVVHLIHNSFSFEVYHCEDWTRSADTQTKQKLNAHL